MDARTKCKVLSGFCLAPGQDVLPGDEVHLSQYQARIECDELRRAVRLPVVEDDSGLKAAALAQAHAELIEQIRSAASIADLEKLLSEDPEIVAAYEQRYAELEEEAGLQEATEIMEGLKAAKSEDEAVSLLAKAKSAVALDLLKGQISAQETGLHAAIAQRLAELNEPDH